MSGDEDTESEHSDPTSSEGSSSESSIEAAINGEEDSEQAIYAKIQAA